MEARAGVAERAGERLAGLMSGVVRLAVPLTVETGVGEAWALAH